VALNQSGQVWFLAPNYGGEDERWATIPTGRMLFIDVAAFIGGEIFGDPPDPEEIYALLTQAVDDIVEVVFEVDGHVLQDLENYRLVSPLFEVTMPENAVFGFPPGTYYPCATEGYFVMLAPLSAGEHTIYIHADLGPIFGTSTVTFHLTVE